MRDELVFLFNFTLVILEPRIIDIVLLVEYLFLRKVDGDLFLLDFLWLFFWFRDLSLLWEGVSNTPGDPGRQLPYEEFSLSHMAGCPSVYYLSLPITWLLFLIGISHFPDPGRVQVRAPYLPLCYPSSHTNISPRG